MFLSLLMMGISHVTASPHTATGRLYVVKGRAFVAGKPDQAGQLVQICRANDTIEVSPHSVATVWLLESGRRYQLFSPSTVKIVNGSILALKGPNPKTLPKLDSGITSVFHDSADQAAVQVRNGQGLRIMPSGGLLTAPGAISWEPCPEAVSYDVSLAGDGSSEASFHSEGITGNSVNIPAGALSLGKTYRLTLVTNLPKGGCVMAFRSLRLISAPESTALVEAQKTLDQSYLGSPETLLAKADLFEEYGLYAKSLNCLMKLQESNPSNSLAQEISKVKSLAEGRS